jgi:hypothetical protein
LQVLLSDVGHEVPTALLPSLLTSLGAPAAALGIVEGLANSTTSGCQCCVSSDGPELYDKRGFGPLTRNWAMTLTAYVAQLLGVYLVLSGVLMIVREQAMMLLVPKFVDTPPFLYFLSSLRVLIGLAIVLAHNMWIGTLGTVIYVVGWLTILRGIAMLVLPAETERKILTAFSRGNVWYTTAIVAIVLGGWLAYAGFTAS